ncbi:MAG: phosphoglucosamine mutase [Ilumatobacteraceae bacterium]
MRFGTDGVRGSAFVELTPEYVAALGRAAAEVLGGGRWLIGRDTRESGPEFERALAAGLTAGGATVLVGGVVPTPAVAFIAARDGIPAAVITASHNPFSDNGVKLFAPGGLKLGDEVEIAVEAAIESAIEASIEAGSATKAATGQGDEGHRCGEPVDVIAAYADHLVSLFPPGCLAGLEIVLDCANGAMSGVADQVARRLGAMVEVINASPDGRNINDDCGATAPGALAGAVLARGADLGLAFDGDGDRVIAIDHDGQSVDGDRMLALAALQMRDNGELIDDTVVITVMSNLGLHHAMAHAGIHIVETAVGDRYVLEALDSGGYALGGEQSGHLIYRKLATTGDGLLAGLRLAQYVHDSRRTLAELAGAAMIGYPQVLLNVPVARRHPGIVDELGDSIAAAEQALAGDGRVLVRASGTEPLIRIMVEAPTTALAASTAEGLAAIVRDAFA